MRILVLESVTGLGEKVNANLFPEGFGMLRTMVNEFSEAGFDVIAPINRKLESLAGWFDGDIYTHNGIEEVMNHKPDTALVMAPERGGELERITAKLRKRGVLVLGPKEDSIRVSADKWLTYLALSGRVPQPRTWDRQPNVSGQVLIKPVDGVGCEGIRFLSTSESKGIIFQEFLDGLHASCCLLIGNCEGIALSVNEQDISIRSDRFEYLGGKVPLQHKLDKMCAETALRAADALGMRGYCGVDLVIKERPYVIEVNPRPTTSFIALANVVRSNLGEILVKALVNGSSVPKPEINGVSVLRIIKIKRDIRINESAFDELREIPGVVAPPLPSDGRFGECSSMLVTGSGGSAKRAERDLINTTEEALSILGVGENANHRP